MKNKMKVYLVVEENWDGVNILCVCSTRAKAQEVLEMFGKEAKYFDILEYEIDSCPKIPKDHYVYEIRLREDGHISWAIRVNKRMVLGQLASNGPWAQYDSGKWFFSFLEIVPDRKTAIRTARLKFCDRGLLEQAKKREIQNHPYLKKVLGNIK